MQNKSVIMKAGGIIDIIVTKLPEPKAHQVQIKMAKSQISIGTDTLILNSIENTKKMKPLIPGYSISGMVTKTGKKVRHLKAGDRVMAIGAGQATHSEYSNVNQNLCAKITNKISFTEGAYAALALTAMQAVRRLDVRMGETHIIGGLGVVGQTIAQLINISGAYTVGLDIASDRIKIAKENGLNLGVKSLCDKDAVKILQFTKNYGVDGGVICFNGEATNILKSIYNLMTTPPDSHRFGRIVVVGGCKFNDLQLAASLGNVDIRSSARTGAGYKDSTWEQGNDYPLGYVRWNTKEHFNLLTKLLEDKKLSYKNIPAKTFKLDDAVKAYSIIKQKKFGKTLALFFQP